MIRSNLTWVLLAVITASSLPSVALGQDEKATDKATEIASSVDKDDIVSEANKERFDKLSKLLTNSALVGHFTIDGVDRTPKQERYELTKFEKFAKDDIWLIQARIKYGDKDVPVPLSIPVKWAGNTPVITVENLTIPFMGTFDAHVVITENRYAGTWQHGDVGGHMFGKIVRIDDDEKKTDDAKKSKPESVE